jgi:hypothetical protein
MKFSVPSPARKWPCGRFGCDQWPAAVLAAVLLMTWAEPASAYETGGAVPLPRPRPAEAPVTEDKAGEKPAQAVAPAAETPPAAPPPSACRQALTESIAIAPSIPPISGPGGCGGDDLVRLEAVVLPDDKGRVALKPAAVLRCSMASAIADWIRTDMAPLAEARGSRLSDLDNFDSYDCRGRNGVAGAPLSEHGRANALDVRALKLASGASIALTDRGVPREVRETVLHSVCTRFTTVLGPGSDGYHEDHIHLDLAERRSGYRICQWDVWDPLPPIAPLLPAERPEQAPPREVAERSDSELGAAPLLPAERPAQAPPREVAEKTGAKSAAPAAPAAGAPPKVAASPEAAAPPAAKSTEPPKPDHPKPKSRPKPRKRHTMPSFFSLFR